MELITLIVIPLLLALATIVTYYPSLHYEFQFDDIANITKHFDIRSNSFANLRFSGTRWISYWINSIYYKLSKFEPFIYRCGSVATHLINGLLIFTILLLVLKRAPQKTFFARYRIALASLTSMLFLLHPVQTQTVTYVIQGQLEGLAMFFTLSMVLCFLLLNYSKRVGAKIFFALVYCALAVLATGSKEIAIVSPLLVLLVDWFFVSRGSVAMLTRHIPFHLVSFAAVIGSYLYYLKPAFFVTILGMKNNAANNLGNIITQQYNEPITPLHFFISQFKVILHYLWIFIWPLHISVEYDWVLVRGFFAPDCLFPFLALCLLSYLVYRLLRKNPTHIVGFAAIWFAIVIAPRSSIVPSPELLVDYKTYMASFGWLFIIAAGLIKGFELLMRYSPNIANLTKKFYLPHIATTALASLLAISTLQRNTVWRSGVDFWANIIENAPGKARAYNNYGVEISQKLGKFAESIQYFEHAIAMDKHYRDPYNNLSVAYAATHQIDKAIEVLYQSLRLYPNYPEAYNNIASFFIEKKEFEKAKEALSYALQLRPYYGKAYFNLGRVYMEQGEGDKAAEAFRKACMEADLDNEAGFMGYAKCCLVLKKYEEGIVACKKTLECNPYNHDIEFNMANAYYLLNQFDNAIATYQSLLQKTPEDPRAWYNLAESYFSAGRTSEALTAFLKLKNSPGITANLFIRIAACQEKLGNPRAAKSSLEELLAMNLPEDARQTVTQARNKLVAQYRLS